VFEKKFRLEIVTPTRIVFRGEACSIIVPGVVSSLGVLAGHMPFLTVLDVGEVMVREEPDRVRYLAIDGGFLEVLPDRVMILADEAEWAEEIDVERADAERRRALKILEEGGTEEEIEMAKRMLKRAQNRIKVAAKAMRGGGAG